MTIEVEGGSATLAGAQMVSGPCSYLLTHSAGEAGAQKTYAAIQLTYNGSADTPVPCQILLTSLYGDTAEVTATLTGTSYQQPCCPSGSCCAEAIALHHRVVFNLATQTVSFPVPPALDGGMEDAALDTGQSPIDADVDVAMDAAIDAAIDAKQDIDLVGGD